MQQRWSKDGCEPGWTDSDLFALRMSPSTTAHVQSKQTEKQSGTTDSGQNPYLGPTEPQLGNAELDSHMSF